jgi:hypothetical protein
MTDYLEANGINKATLDYEKQMTIAKQLSPVLVNFWRPTASFFIRGVKLPNIHRDFKVPFGVF